MPRWNKEDITDAGRVCSLCREFKSWDCFGNWGKGTRGKLSSCKACNLARIDRSAGVDRQYKHRYGISLKDVEVMTEQQEGSCAICKDKALLCVDHCHTTMKVRGLLCRRCNMGIGYFKDNVETLASAITYIKG